MSKQKISSYTKMKMKYEAQIKELQSDIEALLDDTNVVKNAAVKVKYKMKKDLQEMCWLGKSTFGIELHLPIRWYPL